MKEKGEENFYCFFLSRELQILLHTKKKEKLNELFIKCPHFKYIRVDWQSFVIQLLKLRLLKFYFIFINRTMWLSFFF